MFVSVPPSIIDSKTTNDLIVREKERVNLTCEARGFPQPQILWRREDGADILSGVSSVSGPSLVLDSVAQQHIGSYLCIASNGVPPSISKRVDLRVQCEIFLTEIIHPGGQHFAFQLFRWSRSRNRSRGRCWAAT